MRRTRLIAAILFLFIAAGALQAKGARESNELSRADELIAKKEYDAAVILLTEYMNNNPEYFGEAQSRLQKIIRIREQYNVVANELLDTLEQDPEDSERILELSNVLRGMESSSNPATQRFLDQIFYLAEFNVNRKRLERIFVAARGQLEAGDYNGALASYASGLDIYQNEFFTSGYGQEAETIAREGLLGIQGNIQDFNLVGRSLSLAARAISGYSGGGLPNPLELEADYIKLVPEMNRLMDLLSSFIDIRREFGTQLEALQREREIGDRSFLSFALWLLSGPSGQTEGMIGTMDQFWRYNISGVDAMLMTFINRSYDIGYSSMTRHEYSGGIAAFADTSQYIHTALELLSDWNSLLAAENSPSQVVYGEQVYAEKVTDFLKYHTMNESLAYFRRAGEIGNRGYTLGEGNDSLLTSWQAGILEASVAISREQDIRRYYQGLTGELSQLEGEINDASTESRSYLAGLDATPSDFLYYYNDARNITSNLGAFFRSMESNSAIRQYTIANGDLENRVIARENEYRDGNALIEGTYQASAAGGSYVERYPAEGLAVLTRMSQSLATDTASARTLVSQYTEEPAIVRDLMDMRILGSQAQVLLNRLLDLQNRATPVMAAVRTQIERAASLRFEGDRLLQAAQTALNQNNFDAARSNLERATEQYNASLAVQESASLRELWDTRLIPMGATIVRMENEVVVRDVRNLLTTARDQYFAGNIEQAEDSLVRAQNRWRVTNVSEQPEVEYWLSLVRGALSIQSGRTIPPTAPLYAEMSQLLSDANRNYNEGIRYLSGGQRQNGLAVFRDALDKTREVRLMFPLNHEARILELRIEQQTDIPAFNDSFRQRINEAVAGTKTRNAQSFADLQVLAEINPRYQGIGAILSQAEIDMGLRPPPPDPRDLARSTELSRNAQGVINARDSVRYEVAQAWLGDALRLNPTNVQAQTLMDQLQILMTGTGIIVISSYDQEQLNIAQQEYLRGNYLSANSIVMQLLQNPENQKSTQIQELKRRIDSVL